MQALELPKKDNTTEKPWQCETGFSHTKGYMPAKITDSFAFYGRDISEKRYRFYIRNLDRINRTKQDKKIRSIL